MGGIETSLPLPTVIVTSVIRSSYQGQSDGGVYLVDLASKESRVVLDWNECGIGWDGRGGDRGLRGVAFWNGQVYLAASNEIVVYDSDFTLLRSFRNAYLGHCHEIFIAGNELFLTSCGFDSILRYDLRGQHFTAGYCVRSAPAVRVAAKGASRALRKLGRAQWYSHPRLQYFDPHEPGGPKPGDTRHVNSVTYRDEGVYFTGTNLANLYHIIGETVSVHAPIPIGTHNAQPFDGGVLMNDTVGDRVSYRDRQGRVNVEFPVTSYQPHQLRNADLPRDHARQAFARGLALWKDRYVIAGSAPATVSVHDLATGETCCSVNLSMDVRNAIHGLEIWRYPS